MTRRDLGIVLLLCIAATITVMTGPHVAILHNVHASTTSFTLYANYQGWNYSMQSGTNPTITVTKGDTVSFSLIDESGDPAPPHLFLLDLDNTTATGDCPSTGIDKCSGVITSTQTSSVAAFTVSVAPGNYQYYCIYHPGNMVGRFVVNAPAAPPDFSIALSPSRLNVDQGSSGNVVITLTSLNGFSGAVSLSSSLSPHGPQVSFNPASVSLSSGGTSSATASLSAAGSGIYSTPVSAGNYSVNITGASGSLSHSRILSLSVGSSSGAGTLQNPAIIGGGLVVALLGAGSVVFFLRRRSRSMQ